jgi:hypothetical protein
LYHGASKFDIVTVLGKIGLIFYDVNAARGSLFIENAEANKLKLRRPLKKALEKQIAVPIAWSLSENDAPAISVILATQDCASFLEFVLAGLNRQRFPASLWEVIVVDRSSRDWTADLLADFASQAQMKVSLLTSPYNSGLAASMNLALSNARGRIALFLEDTWIPASNWLLHHASVHAAREVVFQGEVRNFVHTHLFPLGQLSEKGFVYPRLWKPQEFVIEQPNNPYVGRFNNNAPSAHWSLLCLANLSLRRKWAEETGGFNEGFEVYWREDFLLRLAEQKISSEAGTVGVVYKQLAPVFPKPKSVWQRELDDIEDRPVCSYADLSILKQRYAIGR